MTSPGGFFIFQILIFLIIKEVKRQKKAQNDKKLSLLCSMSQEPYIIWLSFIVNLCKIDNIFRLCICFIKILFFWVGRGGAGGKRAKNGPKLQKILSVSLYRRYQSSYDCGFWYTCVKWWYLWQFFYFLKILIFLIFRGLKGQKMTSVFHALYLRNCISYHWDFWYTGVK